MQLVGKNTGQYDAKVTMPGSGAKKNRMEIKCLGTITSKGEVGGRSESTLRTELWGRG